MYNKKESNFYQHKHSLSNLFIFNLCCMQNHLVDNIFALYFTTKHNIFLNLLPILFISKINFQLIQSY